MADADKSRNQMATQLAFEFSPFSATLRDGFDRVQALLDCDEFTFIVNGDRFTVPLTDALLLSSRVYKSLQSDAAARSWTVTTTEATAADFARFLNFSLSKTVAALPLDAGLPFLSFCRLLGNDRLALVVLALLHAVGPNAGASIPAMPFCEPDIDFCAALFYVYSAKELRLLDHGVLDRLLASPALSLRTEDDLLNMLLELGNDFSDLWNYIEVPFLSEGVLGLFVDQLQFADVTSCIWEKVGNRLKGLSRGGLSWQRAGLSCESQILMDLPFPSVLSRFCKMKWKLLYRGSRDGFQASSFHSRCDNSANTVTIIKTTTGCIFGGFTPTPWDSKGTNKSDLTRRSFLFRIKDLQGREPRRFPISVPSYAIYSGPAYGPIFGSAHDILVSDVCNQNANSYTNLGTSYVNDTGIDGKQVLAGAYNFTVKDIEVFLINE
jgi:hypothetical protein